MKRSPNFSLRDFLKHARLLKTSGAGGKYSSVVLFKSVGKPLDVLKLLRRRTILKFTSHESREWDTTSFTQPILRDTKVRPVHMELHRHPQSLDLIGRRLISKIKREQPR